MNKLAFIERLLLAEFETVPFHNLFMLSDLELLGTEYGGTCSDKALHFQKVLSVNGIHAQLHSAWINDHRCHRLLTTEIDSQKYFIDVGSGWPILKLIPAFKPIRFTVFGMTFKTELRGKEIHLFHKTKAEFKLMVRIPIESQSESQITDEINNRFIDKSIYPFEKSIRFSKITDESFVFLKGDRLRTFGSRDFQEQILSEAEILNFLAHQMILNDTPYPSAQPHIGKSTKIPKPLELAVIRRFC